MATGNGGREKRALCKYVISKANGRSCPGKRDKEEVELDIENNNR
jgi:hypothetical protein